MCPLSTHKTSLTTASAKGALASSSFLQNQDTDLERTLQALREAQRIAVVSHMIPDADAYASSIGLTLGLRSLGKEVSCYNGSKTLASLRYLPCIEHVKDFTQLNNEIDLFIICDCSKLSIVGEIGCKLLEGKRLLNIDHHYLSNNHYGAVNLVRTDVSSTSEIIYQLLKKLNAEIPPEVATLLIAGIYGDTLSLQKATRPQTLRVVADLIELGGDLEQFVDPMYRSTSLKLLKLKAHLIQGIDTRIQGQYLPIIVTSHALKQFGLQEEDLFELKNLPMEVMGVKIGAFIRGENGFYKISLRSKATFDVNLIAREFGGAGHKNASGFVWRGPLDELTSILESKIQLHLEK